MAPERHHADLTKPSELWVFVRQVVRDLVQDDAAHWAGGIAYYAILSLFPLLLVLISLASYVVEPGWAVERATALLGDFVPEGEAFVRGVMDEVLETRGTAGILSMLALMWTGTRVFGALTRALNVMHDVDESYPLGKRLLVELGMAASVGLVFLAALATDVVLHGLWAVLDLGTDARSVPAAVVRWVAPFVLTYAAFLLLYRYVPRERRYWKSSAIGAAAATALFVGGRFLFYFYLRRFAQYDLIYGSIAIVIVLLVWAWLAALIALVGGEVASHYQMMVVEGVPADEVERRHAARSPVRSNRDDRSSGHGAPSPAS